MTPEQEAENRAERERVRAETEAFLDRARTLRRIEKEYLFGDNDDVSGITWTEREDCGHGQYTP